MEQPSRVAVNQTLIQYTPSLVTRVRNVLLHKNHVTRTPGCEMPYMHPHEVADTRVPATSQVADTPFHIPWV